jgi:hypothetical protein
VDEGPENKTYWWVGLRLKLDFFNNLVKPEPEPDISTI